MIVPNQKNIKVHFAATENVNQFNAIKALGYKYSLYTAYPFLERMIYEKPKHPLIPCQFKGREGSIPQYIINNSKHTIQDSGLFTLMFGSRSGKKDKQFLDMYYEKLVEYTLNHSKGATVVEMDTQKVFGPESAWEYRERLRNDIPNRIINVVHLEDGQKGMDRLIEYSDYIAISVPELRFAKKKQHLVRMAHYIKNKKPDIDIHLLGFTEKRLFEELKFCTSCDSSSYTSGVRYGRIEGQKISNIKHDNVKKLIPEEDYKLMTKYISEERANGLILNIYAEILKYEKHAGNQDRTKHKTTCDTNQPN